jgi:hypothetical protein
MEGVQIPRISAGVIELIVMEALCQHPSLPALSSVRRVVVGSTKVRIELKPECSNAGSPADPVVITVPIRLCRRGNETDIRSAGNAEGLRPTPPDRVLLRGMIRAYQWRSKLESGQFKSLDALARAEKKSARWNTNTPSQRPSAARPLHLVCYLRGKNSRSAITGLIQGLCGGAASHQRNHLWRQITNKQGIKLGNPVLQPEPPLPRVQMNVKFPAIGQIMPRQPEFGTGNYQGIRVLV